MFFITHGRVRKRVADAVRPMLRTIDTTGGVPPGLWDDLTATAFLHGCIRAIVGELSNQKYSGRSGIQISLEVMDDLVGAETGNAIAELHALMMNVNSFKEPFQAGILSVMVAKHHPGTIMDDPIIQRAVLYLPEGKQVTGANVSPALQTLYFYDRVEDLRGT